jgi:sigma-B regulation protein RsbU (phosphoserine phosphatase)
VNNSVNSAIEVALRMQNERLAALQVVALSLTSTLDLDQVLARVVELAQTLSAAAHAHIFLYDRERDELKLAASHWSAEQRQLSLQPRPRGITATVARTGKPQFIADTLAHASYADVAADRKPGALACLPLIKEESVLGTLNLGYWEPHPFDADARAFLNLLAQHAALAIDNARLHALAIEKARMERELEMARAVQTSLMPRTTPHLAGWEFAALWEPARIVGGDMYDFFTLPELQGESLQTISLADVADKGMPAALFMALTRATLRASIAMRCGPADCIAHTNRVLCEDASDGMFVTLCYAQLQTGRGELTFVNAGHTRPLWYRRAADALVELESTGMALGIDAAQTFQERAICLQPGDFVLFYTDGVTDATDARVQEFGKVRLYQLLREQRRASAGAMIAALEQALREFVGSAPQFDDITAVVVKRISSRDQE